MAPWLRALAIMSVALGAQRAGAAIDITGRWLVTSSFGSICLDIGQSGTLLSGLDCNGGGPAYSGTIDPMTGVFTLAQPPGCNVSSKLSPGCTICPCGLPSPTI